MTESNVWIFQGGEAVHAHDDGTEHEAKLSNGDYVCTACGDSLGCMAEEVIET